MARVPDRTKVRRRPWTRKEIYRLVALGFFNGQRVELIKGAIVLPPVRSNDNCVSLSLASDSLRSAFGPEYWVREQGTLDFTRYSVLDPDHAVVPGRPRDYTGKPNPRTALLVVEICDTTLGYDRHRKASVYVRAGIADYWIVHLKGRQLEVRRQPGPGLSAKYDYGYAPPLVFRPGDAVAPLAAPNAPVAVADLLS